VIDLDGDKKPEIVFVAFDSMIHAIRGDDCKDVWAVPKSAVVPTSDLAAGDLDGDGKPEVVGLTSGKTGGGVAVFDGQTGKLLAERTSDPGFGWDAPAIANIDGVGPAEIIADAFVYRYEGGKIEKVFGTEHGSNSVGTAVDLDEDGLLEVVGWGGVFDVSGKNLVKFDGMITAVADFDPTTPGAEIIGVNNRGEVMARAGLLAPEPGKVLFGPFTTTGGGGPPAVADFDGDGEPEIGVAGATHYSVFDRGCDVEPLPSGCASRGVRWRQVTQDASSAVTTSTVFDFNCDGQAEVVYRDECWLRVFDGKTGDVRFATTLTSNTALEGAVVADTDGSGHAKIVIATNDISTCDGMPEAATGAPWTGKKRGVFILRDPMDRWAPTRPIWNQNPFHVTNVNDDGTIPMKEMPSWKAENTWRANEALRR